MSQLSLFDCETEHASISAKVPSGWTSVGFSVNGIEYKKAIDIDGCCWYWSGEWILNVQSFSDTHANVETISGHKACPISDSGVITIGNRRISSRKWDH